MKHIFFIKNPLKYTVLIALILSGVFSKAQKLTNSTINYGVLDLRTWNFQNNHIAAIDGRTEFYWEEFLTIDEIKSGKIDDCFVNIMNSWNNQADKNCRFPVMGYATYHFKINLSENEIGKYFILRPDHFIAYSSQIYVNNQLVVHNGYVGHSINDKSYKPSRKTSCTPFVADSTVLDVVIWVANYHHFRGGIFNRLKLGYATDMISEREKAITYDLIVIISLLTMFFYHFLFHFLNAKEKASLFFSLTCLVFAFDRSFQDTMVFFLFFPKASFTISSFFHLSLPYMIPSSFLFFLHALFPNEVSKTIRNIVGIITIVLVSATILNIPSLNSFVSKPHYAYTFLIVLYIYFVAIKAVIKKRESAGLFLIAYLIFSIFAINDILLVFELIHTTNMVSSGLMVFIFLLSILQGRRFSQISKRNIKLTNHLKQLNENLTKQVGKRTKELRLSLDKVQKINEFKEDLTAMFVHDLKNPLNSIINLTQSDTVRQSGFLMLNMIMNILDVQKYENTKIQLYPTNNSLYDITNTALQQVNLLYEQKNIRLQNKVKNQNVLVEKEIIERVFVNILTNAIKFTPNNGTISIETDYEPESLKPVNKKFVKVKISDTGKGIPANRLNTIFGKFEQVIAKKSGLARSSGIGLAFCKLFVEAHNGKIGVESKLEKGTTFWFTLPTEKQNFISNSYNEENVQGLLNNISVKNNFEDKTFELKDIELQILRPYLLKLQELQVYEYSSIMNIIKQIDFSENDNLKIWEKEMYNALSSINEEKYAHLIFCN